jgi:hypothetical protein
MRKMAAALGFFCAILLVLMASVPEASAMSGARGPRGPVKVDRPVGHCGWVRGVWVCR